MTDETSRRDLLRAGGALASTAAVGGLGGCLGGLASGDDNGDGDDLDYETVGVEFSLDSWLFEPGTISDRDHYSFTYRSYEAFAEARPNLSADTAESIDRKYSGRPMTGVTRMPMGDVSHYLSLGPRNQEVMYGTFEPGPIASGLIDNLDFESKGSHAGFEVLETPVPSQNTAIAFGISENVILRVEDPDAAAAVERVADTPGGATTSYADADEDMSELLGHLELGDWVEGETGEPEVRTNVEEGRFEGQVGFGHSMAFDGERFDVTYVVSYNSEADVDLDQIDRWIEANRDSGERFEHAYDVSVEREGRSALVSASRDTETL